MLGKEQIHIGSAPDNDVILQGPGVGPHHARIVKQNGALLFLAGTEGPSFANGQPIAANQPVPFDFRTQFSVAQAQVPLSHPAIVMAVMALGQAHAPRGQLIIGREPTAASLVIANGAVSANHATVFLDRMMVQDNGSTSGTYVGGQRIPANQPVPIDPNGVIAFGPVPVPVSVLAQIAQGNLGAPAQGAAAHAPVPNGVQGAQGQAPQAQGQPAHAGAQGQAVQSAYGAPGQGALPQPGPPQAVGPHGAGSPGNHGDSSGSAPRKHRTVIGELSMVQLDQATISIGRTPDNQIVVPHPQVSSRHALIVKQGQQLFLEDQGSANGTFVRGQRLAPKQRVPIANGEKVFIGPMPLLIQIADSKGERRGGGPCLLGRKAAL